MMVYVIIFFSFEYCVYIAIPPRVKKNENDQFQERKDKILDEILKTKLRVLRTGLDIDCFPENKKYLEMLYSEYRQIKQEEHNIELNKLLKNCKIEEI